MGELAALGTAFLWAFNGLLLRPVAGRQPPLRITSLEFLISAVLFVVMGLAGGQLAGLFDLSLAHILALAATAIFGLGGGDMAYLRSLAQIGLARAFTISTAGYFVITVGVSALVLHEPVTTQQVLGALVMLGGIWVLARERNLEPVAADDAVGVHSGNVLTADALRVGLAFAGLAAVCWGLNTVALRVLLEGVDLLVALPVRLVAAALVLNVLAHVKYGPVWRDRREADTVRIVGAGLIGLGVGSLLYLYAIQTAGAAKTAILSSASPLFAAVLAATVLREPFTREIAVGTALVVVGMVAVSAG